MQHLMIKVRQATYRAQIHAYMLHRSHLGPSAERDYSSIPHGWRPGSIYQGILDSSGTISIRYISACFNDGAQYNAATNNARSGSSYAETLFGPPPATFSNNGNLVALDVLNAAFDMIPKNA